MRTADRAGDVGATAPRPRAVYALLVVSTVVLGLGSRRYGAALPDVLAAYAGDALWAAMVFWLAAIVRPRARTLHVAAAALAISFAVESTQLYRAPWIDAVRSNRLGALALGQGFLWTDLACYMVGVCVAALLDHALRARLHGRRRHEPGVA